MDYKALVKQRNKYLIIYLVVMFSGIIPIVAGGVILDETKLTALGIVLIVLGILLFVGSSVWVIVKSSKLNKLINEALEKMEIEKFNRRDGIRTFKTFSGNEIEFDKEFYTINGVVYRYDECDIVGSFYYGKFDLTPSISIAIPKENRVESIELCGDLFDELTLNDVKITNQEDLDYYKENIILCRKHAINNFAFRQQNILLMEFKKNKEDAKRINKQTRKSIIGGIVGFVIVMAINVLLIWLGDSETGIDFSNKIGLDWIFKVGYSIILIALIFYKSSNFKLLSKVSIGVYLTLYWLGLFFFNGRVNIMIDLVFFYLFIVIGVYELIEQRKHIEDENQRKNTIMNRFIGISIFLMLMLTFTIMEFTFVNEWQPWLYSLYAMLGLLVVLVVGIYLYNKKHTELTKKQKILNYVCYIFGFSFLLYLLSALTIVNLNYALDKSEPVINSYEIIELTNGSDNDSDSATIVIDGVQLEIAISDEEYHKFEVGDLIEIYYFEGAFNMPYYIHYEE